MKTADLVAIDVHTHAEVSCRDPADEVWKEADFGLKGYKSRGQSDANRALKTRIERVRLALGPA